LNPENILYSKQNKTLTIIDWEQASVGDHAMDVAKLFLKSGFSPEERQEFLAMYMEALHKKALQEILWVAHGHILSLPQWKRMAIR